MVRNAHSSCLRELPATNYVRYEGRSCCLSQQLSANRHPPLYMRPKQPMSISVAVPVPFPLRNTCNPTIAHDSHISPKNRDKTRQEDSRNEQNRKNRRQTGKHRPCTGWKTSKEQVSWKNCACRVRGVSESQPSGSIPQLREGSEETEQKTPEQHAMAFFLLFFFVWPAPTPTCNAERIKEEDWDEEKQTDSTKRLNTG